MRMWMVDPRQMCNKHLLGEHVETHMFLGTIRKGGIRFDGYFKNNLFEPKSLKERHDALALEMQRRGMNHQSPLDVKKEDLESLPDVKVNTESALKDLVSRCPVCRKSFSKDRPNSTARRDYEILQP